VDELLRRASLQDRGADLVPSDGPTLDDLMAAAAEVGLDPHALRRAASIVPAAEGGVATAVFGAPDRRRMTAFLDGSRLPEEHGELARASERLLGRPGTVQGDGPHFAWTERHGLGRTTVKVAESAEGTEVRVDADRAGHYLASWFAGVAGWGLLSGLTPLGALGPVAGVLSFLVLPILLVRPFWKRSDRKLRRNLEELTLELARIVDEDGQAPQLESGGSDSGS
jgi:hypothetical protein